MLYGVLNVIKIWVSIFINFLLWYFLAKPKFLRLEVSNVINKIWLERVCAFYSVRILLNSVRKVLKVCEGVIHFSGPHLKISEICQPMKTLAKNGLMRCQKFLSLVPSNPPNIYLFKVNNRNTRKGCEIWSKLQ